MKPLYIILVMWALFITGLCGGISFALAILPGVGIILALVITFCINATMGSGLLYVLISNNMYHPKFGPPMIIGGFIPGFDLLPFWLGLVIAGIAQDMSKEKSLLGETAGIAVAVQSGKPAAIATAVTGAVQNERRATGRPPQAANDNEPQEEQEQKSRASLNLKSPSMHNDIYVQKAA